MQFDVLLTVQEKPHSSLKELEAAFVISKATAWRILHRYKHHPYKIQPFQLLMEDDFDMKVTVL